MANSAVPTRDPAGLPAATEVNLVMLDTCCPGHPDSHASAAVAYEAVWATPPQVALTDPSTCPTVATGTGVIAAAVAVSSASVTGRANLNGSAIGRSLIGMLVVVVVGGGGGGGGGGAVVVVVVVGAAGSVDVDGGGAVVVVVVVAGGATGGRGLGSVGGGVGWPSTATRTRTS